MKTLRWTLLSLALSASFPALAADVAKVPGGVVVTPDAGPAKRVRVLVYGPDRFRVTAVPDAQLDTPDSLMVTAKPAGDFTVSQTRNAVMVKTAGGSAEIDLDDGQVRFRDAAGKLTLEEASRAGFTPVTAGGEKFVAVRQQFNRGTDEGFYGLGQHQNRQMNYNGEDVELAQHNMDIGIPFVVSTKNYGVLWDNNGITRFGNPQAYRLVGDGMKVMSGGKPGWQAQYYLGDKLAVTRTEPTINYQFIKDQANWPAAAKAQTVAATTGQNTAGNAVQTQKVVWTGTVMPTATGVQKFRLYSSSYVKVFVDGKEVLNRWRQNWNPWFHNFDLPMTAGKAAEVRIEWEPNAGYIALYQNDPLPTADRHSLWWSSDVAHALDYYYVGGKNMDGVIAGYRALTGKAALMPRWAYGFWQSRQRYNTQDELLGVVREYRKRGLPIDNIVQDWFYWPEDQWGCHCFDPKRFPKPQQMVDELHASDARIMISVWPKFYPNTKNAQELAAKGYLYQGNLIAKERDWVGKGYLNTDYDPYAAQARAIYFRQMKEALVDKGFDAWWMDATEPDIHSNLSIEQRMDRMGPTAQGPAQEFFNSYPLVHAEGVADGLRMAKPDVRPFILTRSGYGGIQRASAALWSGDVASRWDDLRDQISAGVNLSMSGIPNWTHDIGGFAVEDRYSKKDPAHLAEWKELNLRWFQFGAFSPLFRSHGETPFREIYELGASDPALYQALGNYDRLRYRLLPYILSLAAENWHRDGTMMRGLVMDFAADRKTWGIDDEYMFGSAFLVAPVTQFGARSRQVYLPAGADWYDFATGAYQKGGRTITAAAPLATMPLYVRAGSIVPTGAAVQSTAEQPDGPYVLHVFTGKDGAYTLFEDDGLSEGYRKGQSAQVPVTWNEATKTLTIGARQGSFPGMVAQRAMSVRFHSPGKAVAPDFADNKATTFVYDGRAVTVPLSGRPQTK
ncbi:MULTISPECIES: glycoside hydrolase family 31 protein [unclassified Sphingomonas]|uniref:glycoside hydrolase family 31 protein n=1 Tax=unclassified Sphingomonas TaxID=196159 RepID=UPI0006F31E61|nr:MULTISPECIES: TIM-barrel domain-containing protein [unclassified Sphingomonas]KQM24793.1 alpha-xylosidase [Sphingomonas sp. Leaf9]KQM42451.1 alpha-xylosidase [Sphingomonas sp. Leaf11]